MQFTRLISAFFALFVLRVFVLATPTPVKLRSDSAVQAIVSDLESEITQLVSNLPVVNADVNLNLVIPEVTAALLKATNSITSLDDSDGSDASGIAPLLQDVIETITTTLSSLGAENASDGDVLGPLDTALAGLLNSVQTILSDVLSLVSGLGGDVSGLLNSLGLGVTVAALGS